MPCPPKGRRKSALWLCLWADGTTPITTVTRSDDADARALTITAVLRSWEKRFGARLLQFGADSILRVLVERPPRTPEHAQQVAAEHIAFADDFDRESDNTVTARAASIIGAPIWSFWWD